MGNYIGIENNKLLECAELFKEVFNSEPWMDKWTVDTAHKRLKDIFMSQNFEGLVYTEDGVIKGAVFGNYEQFYDGVHYNLKELFISNELRGKGVGSKLLEELENRLKKIGITEIILFTARGDKTSKFYSNNGFDEFNSMVIMGKEIL